LRLVLGPGLTGSAGASWTFSAPPGTSVVRVRANRGTSGFDQPPENAYWAYSFGPVGGARSFEACDKKDGGCPNNISGALDATVADASQVRLSLHCANGPDACLNTEPIQVAATRVAVGLKDESKPQIVAQRIVDNGDRSGVFRTRFSATDQGGGLYRVRTLVDGQPHTVEPVTGGTCTDAQPGNADEYEFLSPQPCPLGMADREVAVNAAALPPGPHTVLTEVEDAAGNTQTVNATQFPRVNVNDGGPGGGSGSGGSGGGGGNDDGSSDYDRLKHAKVKSWFDTSKRRNDRKGTRKAKTRLTINRGKRALVRGTIRDRKGKGIVGATLDVYHLTRDGKRRLVKTGVKTRKKGYFTYIVSSNVDTRRLQMAYRALRPGKITSRKTLRLTVKRKGKTYYMPENRQKPKKKATATR